MKLRNLKYLAASAACAAVTISFVSMDGGDAFFPVAEASAGASGPMIGHHSFVKPYVSDYWQEGIPHWELGGDAVVTNKYVRLTPKLNSKYGWIWNDQPNDNQHFEARLGFISRNKRVAQADGLALWLITNPNKNTFANPGPIMGMHSNFQGIGIVLDTYDNDNRRDNPLVSLVVNMEGMHRTWDIDKDLTPDSRARCTFDFRTAGEVASELIMTVLEKKLTVRMRNPERSLDTICFEVDGISFSPTEEYFFGLTASTGQIADNHDIVSFELRPLGSSIGDPNIPLDHHDDIKDKTDQSYHGDQHAQRKRPRHSEPINDFVPPANNNNGDADNEGNGNNNGQQYNNNNYNDNTNNNNQQQYQQNNNNGQQYQQQNNNNNNYNDNNNNNQQQYQQQNNNNNNYNNNQQQQIPQQQQQIPQQQQQQIPQQQQQQIPQQQQQQIPQQQQQQQQQQQDNNNNGQQQYQQNSNNQQQYQQNNNNGQQQYQQQNNNNNNNNNYNNNYNNNNYNNNYNNNNNNNNNYNNNQQQYQENNYNNNNNNYNGQQQYQQQQYAQQQ